MLVSYTNMEKAIAYIKKTLGITVKRMPASNNALAVIPNAIRFQYLMEQWDVYNTKMIALLPQGEHQSPKELSRHAELVYEKTGIPVVLVFETLPAYARTRLAEKGQSFVVPDRQIFIPKLMLVANERATSEKKPPVHLSALAQLLVLFRLQKEQDELGLISGKNLAARLGGSAMTWSRALSELVALEAGEEKAQHKFRYFRFALSPAKLWEKLQPYLRTPVLKSLWVKDIPLEIHAHYAGNTALSKSTDIAEPAYPVYAAVKSAYQAHKKDLVELPWPEDGCKSLQVWRYNPEILTHDKYVDPLSLYLSLKTEDDERIVRERNKLLKGMQWFED
jgi:hypothetical protein